MKMINVDDMVAVLQRAIDAKTAEVREMEHPGNPTGLVKEGHINGLEAALVLLGRVSGTAGVEAEEICRTCRLDREGHDEVVESKDFRRMPPHEFAAIIRTAQ